MTEKELPNEKTTSEQQEIEQLREDIKNALPSSWYWEKDSDSECYFIAQHLYEKGYRKQ